MRTKIGKIAVLLFAVVMCLACFNMNVYAAYSEIEAVGTTVELDGTNDATVTVSLSAANGFALLGIQGVWATSEDGETNYFTLVDLGFNKLTFNGTTNAYDAATGEVIWADDNFVGVEYEKDAQIMTATYKVAANTPEGIYTVHFATIYGADMNFNEFYDTFTATITVTHKAACDHVDKGMMPEYIPNKNGTHNVKYYCDCGEELVGEAENNVPCFDSRNNETLAVGKDGFCDCCEEKMPCDHSTTKLVPNDNGTHNVVCANAECNHVVNENVTCTGTDDGDCTTAVICECGNIVTAAKDSHTGGEATCAKRAECTECGQEYGELNANNHKDTYIAEGFYPDSSDDAYHYQWLACNDCTNKTIEKVNREKHDDQMGDGDHNCDKCGETCSFHTGGTATCTAKAECTECGAEYGNFANHEYMHPCDPVCCICYEVTNPDATHSIIQVEAKAGTDCQTYDGNIEYWYCEHCGAAWLDEECTSPTNTLNVKVAGEHTYTYDCDTNCKVCEELTRPEAKHEGGTATCQNQAVCEDCNKPYGEKNADNHTQELKYVNKGENHVSYYPCCQTEANGTTENHTYGEDTHKCICDAVETFTLTVMDMEAAYSGNYPPANKIFTVPYGTNILDYIKEQIDLGNVDMSNQTVNDETRIGTYIFDGDWRNISAGWGNVEEDSIVSGDTRITVGADFTGWIRVSENSIWGYQNRGHNVVGWYEIEGDWYYFFKTEESNYNFRAEGLTRVPYPTEPINGKTYAPNAEDLAYADFIDATEAWFVFGEDGKFQFDMTEIMDGKYVENGMIPWHPGFVTVEENVYYFCGDVDYGGNKMVTGWYYATRGGESGKYYFGLDGVLVKNHGVAEVEGVLYYFENGKLMQGKGLLKTDKGFIYVRTSGQLAIGKYYISNTANYGGDELGYGNGVFFGADGYALQGIVDGKYYINGRVAYGAGVVEVEEGKYIYVRSNGELVKNTTYWITNVGETGVVAKDYAFDKNGCFVPEFVADQKNGIVEEDGVLYYYENGNIVYGAGLTEIDGDIYYVRSNGQVATGEYWITNTNGLLEAGKYNFGTDGKLITE